MKSGWDALTQAVSDAQALIAAAAPDESVAAEGEAYVARLASSSLADATLGHLLSEDGLSRPLPTRGGPNPDYIMRYAPLDRSRRYRLDGRLNGSERVGVGLYAYGANGAPLEVGYASFAAETCGPDGAFSLDVAADAEGEGALAIAPDARVLLIRILHRDASAEPARLRWTGADPVRNLSLTTGTTDGALSFAARNVANGASEYLKWTSAVVAQPNIFAPPPPELAVTVQGDPDTLYYLSGFHFGEGEWLEITMPANVSGYWSIHAYNYWFEHLQTPGVHDRNAVRDGDGLFRIRVGADAPADLPNRIDTQDRRRGALICRIIGQGGCPAAKLIRSRG